MAERIKPQNKVRKRDERPSPTVDESIINVTGTESDEDIPEVKVEPTSQGTTEKSDTSSTMTDQERPAKKKMMSTEFKFIPPTKQDMLPDILRLIESVDDSNTDLAPTREPPALFTRPEYVPTYKKIADLRQEIEHDGFDPYLDSFEDHIKDEVVMLGNISLEEIQEEEKQLRDEHIAYLEQEAKRSRLRQEDLLAREELTKLRLAKLLKEKRGDIARREELLEQREKILLDRLHKSFRRAESHLIDVLEKRKGEVKIFYGDLIQADGQYGGSKGRRWKVDWDRTPQPIQVKLSCLRGVKDKLPAGRYVLLVSLHDRLGGHALRWSKLKGSNWGGATLPILHEGSHHNVEMKLDQSLFTVLPSQPSIRPGMILVFELFLLRGSLLPTDRVVGWGCFPISDAEFQVVEGKFKAPFLRGEMDYAIDKHEKIEELMASDVDHWLCNLYFEVVKLPRYLAGQKEFEVELQFSSGLTGYPDRVKTGWEEYRDGEKPLPGPSPETSSNNSDNVSQVSVKSGLSSLTEKGTTRSDAATSKVKLSEKSYDSESEHGMPVTTIGSRFMKKEKKLDLNDSSEDSDVEIENRFAVHKDENFKPVKNTPGMFYKRYLNNPSDVYFDKLYSVLPKTNLLNRKKKRKLTHIEQLEQHSFAVHSPISRLGRPDEKGREKVDYISRQFLAELGLSQWRSREFWGMLLMLLIVFFIRLYFHYTAQWLFLQAIEIPVNKFEFLPYTVELNYQSSLLYAREEIGMVVFGPLLNIVVFSLLVIFSWICQKMFGFLPDLGSKFILAYGILTFFDPLLILIIDLILQRHLNNSGTSAVADCAKLWWHFDRTQGSGVGGLFITLFLYSFTGFMSGSILYMYFLRLHNNGRMLDLFWRLHSKEDNFFIPYDLELSNQELNHICRKSEQWRGEEGERRKVAVYDYIWEEDSEMTIWDEKGNEKIITVNEKETTTHVSIHILHLDGLRELYRHFLRLPDGAIVEVYGDMSVPGMDKDIKSALESGAKGLEEFGTKNVIRERRLSTELKPKLPSNSPRTNHGGSTSSLSSGSDKKKYH